MRDDALGSNKSEIARIAEKPVDTWPLSGGPLEMKRLQEVMGQLEVGTCHGTLKVICSLSFVFAAQAIKLPSVLGRLLTDKRQCKQPCGLE